MSKAHRSKLLSVYLRPWTLIAAAASDAVPYLKNLQQSSQGMNIRHAWKHYIAHILPHAKRQIQNFMLACLAEGRTTRDDEEGAACRRGGNIYLDITSDDNQQALKLQAAQICRHEEDSNDATVEVHQQQQNNERVEATAKVALLLAEQSQSEGDGTKSVKADSLTTHLRTLQKAPQQTNNTDQERGPPKCFVKSSSHDWKFAYKRWQTETFDPFLLEDATNAITPNLKQSLVLKDIHDRCVCEEQDKHRKDVSAVLAPLLRLIHGLPGSGKSALLSWTRSYFEVVWLWTYGEEFVYLAPLNSMANGICGSTVHSWGRIGFKDRRGMNIAPREKNDAEVPTMT